MADDGVDPGLVDGARPTVAALRKPYLRARRWADALIWIVPVAALALSTFYLRQWYARRGPEIVVRAESAVQFQPGETPVRSRGVEVGVVTRIVLARDKDAADVTVQLRRDAGDFARDGAHYWVIKPKLSGGTLVGVGTLLTGPYLEAMPGDGPARRDFVAGDSALAPDDALPVRLVTARLDYVQRDTPIYYRGVRVGRVESIELGADSTFVVVHGHVSSRYAPLVRADSKFWSEPPANVKGGLFSGVQVDIGSLRQVLAGRVNFASPDTPLADPAAPDALFQLADQPEPQWLKWLPQIAISPGPATRDSLSPGADAGSLEIE